MSVILMTAALLAAAPVPQVANSLSTSEASSIRKGTYGQPLAECAPPPDSLKLTLLVPEAVRRAYASKPAATVELLLRIADGGSPSDSVVATSYVLELSGGPGAGLAYVHLYKWDAYDQLDPDYGATPRQHMGQAARKVYLKSVGGKR